MEATGIFETLAQIAITLAGFSGVVVALGDRFQAERRAMAHAQLLNLLYASLGATFFAFLPQLLFAWSANAPFAWRASHGLFGAYHVLAWGFFVRRAGLRVGRDVPGGWVFWALTPGGVAVVAIHAVILLGGLPEAAFAGYLAGLLWILLIAAIQFTVLLGT